MPAGSGNGLARELGLPWDPAAALGVALGRRERVIDVGDVEGRLFVNLAGIGLDAQVAALFNARAGRRRGLWPYVAIGAREILRYRAREYTIRVGAETWQERALVIVCANARQYGGGAVVAPTARPDDGQLDVVTVATRPPLLALRDALHLFRGTLDRAPGVTHQADAGRGDLGTGADPVPRGRRGGDGRTGPDGADPSGRAPGAGALSASRRGPGSRGLR